MNINLSMKFEIPSGNWLHVKKSWSWEQYNENFAKGKTGTFSMSGYYLRWQSLDGTTSMFIEVKELTESKDTLWILHRSGLEYWFKRKSDDGVKKKREVKRRHTKESDGRGDQTSVSEERKRGHSKINRHVST